MNMKKNLFIISLVIISFTLASNAWAHEPRYITDDQLVVIKKSDISQAFYGELKGGQADYIIDLKQTQDLYFQILVPDLPGIQKDKTITVYYVSDLGQPAVGFLSLDPNLEAWTNFYEEYAGDNYWQGPQEKKTGEPGYYYIKISSPDNLGKYVLVVGDKEEFPPAEIAKALITIPQLKTKFFDKPIWQSFQGKIGKYFGISLLILIVFGYLFHRFQRVYK
jgi:hypothetical protein